MERNDLVEDALVSIQAQLHYIETRMLHIALTGRVTSSTKTQLQVMLKDISDRFEKLPTA